MGKQQKQSMREQCTELGAFAKALQDTSKAAIAHLNTLVFDNELPEECQSRAAAVEMELDRVRKHIVEVMRAHDRVRDSLGFDPVFKEFSGNQT